MKEFMTIGGKLLHGKYYYSSCLILAHSKIQQNKLKQNITESFAGITRDTLLKSLEQLHDLGSIDIVNFSLPNLPAPPNAFRGIRRKGSSLRRWLTICSDDTIKWVDCSTVDAVSFHSFQFRHSTLLCFMQGWKISDSR